MARGRAKEKALVNEGTRQNCSEPRTPEGSVQALEQRRREQDDLWGRNVLLPRAPRQIHLRLLLPRASPLCQRRSELKLLRSVLWSQISACKCFPCILHGFPLTSFGSSSGTASSNDFALWRRWWSFAATPRNWKCSSLLPTASNDFAPQQTKWE